MAATSAMCPSESHDGTPRYVRASTSTASPSSSACRKTPASRSLGPICPPICHAAHEFLLPRYLFDSHPGRTGADRASARERRLTRRGAGVSGGGPRPALQHLRHVVRETIGHLRP